MNTEIIVTSLEHEELVDILSTALYGCNYLSVDLDDEFYNKIPEEKRQGHCVEDEAADILLNGGELKITDYEADGELYLNKLHPQKKGPYLDKAGRGVYFLTLQDFLWACSTERGYKLVNEVLDGTGDYFTANNLLQIAMFGEEIYG